MQDLIQLITDWEINRRNKLVGLSDMFDTLLRSSEHEKLRKTLFLRSIFPHIGLVATSKIVNAVMMGESFIIAYDKATNASVKTD